MQFATVWMKLELILMSEVRQKETEGHRMIILNCEI